MKRLPAALLLLACLLLASLCCAAPPGDAPWLSRDADGATRVHLYFFWSARCPHCQEAKPYVEDLAVAYPWLELHSYEVNGSAANRELYRRMAGQLGEEAASVPAFLFCGQMRVGYAMAESTGEALRQALLACRAAGAAAIPEEKSALPLGLNPEALSLPLFTLIIAGLDAFNPCAFFVLLFLLSLLAREHSRARMGVIGGVFVLCSGLVYFLFMAAWLNAFLLIGELRAVTAVAGAIAIFLALLNIKDFFRFRQGPTLSIPDSAKPVLYRRVRGLLAGGRWPALLLGTATLAVAANSYELLCTAGFPMIYTRTLTLHGLSPAAYYAYLALYNVIYVIPLGLIVLGFVHSLGQRKLGEREGRLLKLLSGTMMLGLGVLLVAAPHWLSSLWAAAALLLAAVAVTAAVARMR
ncbi:MAG: thioredoxin family protein [Burkholderiales bacterium]